MYTYKRRSTNASRQDDSCLIEMTSLTLTSGRTAFLTEPEPVRQRRRHAKPAQKGRCNEEEHREKEAAEWNERAGRPQQQQQLSGNSCTDADLSSISVRTASRLARSMAYRAVRRITVCTCLSQRPGRHLTSSRHVVSSQRLQQRSPRGWTCKERLRMLVGV